MIKKWKLVLTLLAFSQSFSQSISIFILTISSILGVMISGNENFATVPIAAVFSGTIIGIFPLAKAMKSLGRTWGFRIAIFIGLLGTLICFVGLRSSSLFIFSAGHVLLGIQLGGFQFLRFAASEIVPVQQKSKAISLVLAGGIVAAFLGPWLAHYSRTVGMVNNLSLAYLPLVLLYFLLIILFIFMPKLDLIEKAEEKNVESVSIKRSFKEIYLNIPFLQALVGSSVGYSLMILLMTATPMAMGKHGFESHETSMVIQWHVLGMFVPSFFTGSLIKALGHRKIILMGVVAILIEILIVYLFQELYSFVLSLTLLGIGWNFIYVSSTSRLTYCYKDSEKEKVQATHDLIVFSFSTLSTFLAGPLLKNLGWVNMHIYALVVLALTGMFILLKFKKKDVGTVI